MSEKFHEKTKAEIVDDAVKQFENGQPVCIPAKGTHKIGIANPNLLVEGIIKKEKAE
jgi:hypothetical protein